MRKSGLTSSIIADIKCRKKGIQKNLIKWGKQNFRQFQWRQNRTPYSVLVSELLLKRTTATAAKRVFKEFMCLYPNIQKLSQADSKGLERFLSKIGYHKRRTKILVDMANYILGRHNGEIPRSKEELMEIPYVGSYTANAILTFGYAIPSAIVDSNVDRIIRRLFFKHLPSKGSFRLIQKVADLLCPLESNQAYNYALLDFGAVVCRYGNPRCNICPIRDFCDYYLSRNAISKKTVTI